MQTKTSKNTKLTARDFTYVYEPGIGRTYQNGPYLILCGRESYSVAYKGQTFSWGLTNFLSAIEHCQRHDEARRAALPPKPVKLQWLGGVVIAYDGETMNEIFVQRLSRNGNTPRVVRDRLAKLGYDTSAIRADSDGMLRIWI